MTKRDMHIHTTYSDGSLSPEEVVTLSARLGIGQIAITDHDTMAGCAPAVAVGRALNVAVVPGAELSAWDSRRDRKVHLLGYGIRDSKTLEEVCRPYLKSRHEAQHTALGKVIEAGYPLTKEEVLVHTGPGGALYRQHIMHALVNRGYATAIYGELYQSLFGKGGTAFVRSEYMDVFDALRLVLDCGGLPVLAHPFLYDSLDLFPELVDRGLRGMEVWHSKHSPDQCARLSALADAARLEKYAGSDFHGFYGQQPNPLGNHNEV